MATLTTVDGIKITFKPRSVKAIAKDHDLSGKQVTIVYGITDGFLIISETALEFMSRLKIDTKNFAQFTRPNGSPVWISGEAVSSIRAPLPDEYDTDVNTVIFADSLTQAVQESPVDVAKELND